MLRNVAVIGAAVVGVQILCAGAQAQPVTEAQAPIQLQSAPDFQPPSHRGNRIARLSTKPVHPAAAVRHTARIVPPAVQPPPETPPGLPPELSEQEEHVRGLAGQNGDQDFLMVDKTLGRIILFQHDTPVFSGSALTGESTADRFPPDVLTEKFSKLNALDTKVTPAGRFTVRRGHDRDYGPLLDINEIHGKDWGIAIHQVYLGTPSEHRDARIQSQKEEDKHITYGCINVTPETIRYLLKELPKKSVTPLYILPEDEAKTEAYFTPHNTVGTEVAGHTL